METKNSQTRAVMTLLEDEVLKPGTITITMS